MRQLRNQGGMHMSDEDALLEEIQRLKQENFYLHNIIKHSPGSFYWKDTQGVYLGCNQLMQEMAGTQYVVGKTDFDLPWHKEAPKIRANDEKVMKDRKALEIEEQARVSNGSHIIFLTCKTPLLNESNEVIGVIGSSIDITERKILEKELLTLKEKIQSEKLKTKFIANMSHDFTTTLTSIIGLSDLLLKNTNQAQQNKYILNIQAASQTLLALIEDVLEASKASHQKNMVRHECVDPYNLMLNIDAILRSQATDKGLKFHIEVNNNMKILSDNNRLTRILMNLIGNAIKFTPKGSVHAAITITTQKSYEALVEITVSDTGIGIDKNQHQDIFNRFIRIPSANHPGSGLGLDIVKNFVDDLNGKIQVESELNQGTTFRVTFPCPLIQENPFSEPEKPTKRQLPCCMRVLLVEDNLMVSHIAKEYLQDLGCHVDYATTGKEALETLSPHHDLILLDISLPDISGIEITEIIRNKQGGLKNIPIIAHTAHLSPSYKTKAMDAGINAFLNKPASKNKMESVISEVLQSLALTP